MEVTNANFAAAADELESLLPTAAFVAIDEEMTGIMLDKSTAPNAGDTVERRYQKMKRVTEEFNLMQVGICLYHREVDGDDSRLIARPYNFYVIPDAKSTRARLTMHVSTAEFHKTNGMDFNKWLCEGVPFLSHAELSSEMAALDETLAEQAKPPAQRMELTRESDKEFVSGALEGVAAWLAALGGCGGEHALPECNAFLRRALFESIAVDFPDLAAESRALPDDPSGKKKQLVVLALNEEDKAARLEHKRQAKIELLHARAGFHRVFRMLADARRPLIGHNLTYDLLFLISHFHGPLPPTLAECKSTVHGLFPEVWDTKLCSVASGQFTDTMLAKLHEACVETVGVPSVQLASGFGAYASGERCHEAGYDAFITGVAHAALRHLGHAPASRRNLCYLMRSLSVLNLGGDDATTESGAIVHLRFATSRTTNDLFELLTPLLESAVAAAAAAAVPSGSAEGAPRRPPRVNIRWIDESSAFAVFPAGAFDEDAEQAAAAVGTAVLASGDSDVTPTSFDRWRQAEVAEVAKEAAQPTAGAAAAPAAAPSSAKAAAPSSAKAAAPSAAKAAAAAAGSSLASPSPPCRNWDGTPGSCHFEERCYFQHDPQGGRGSASKRPQQAEGAAEAPRAEANDAALRGTKRSRPNPRAGVASSHASASPRRLLRSASKEVKEPPAKRR